MRRCSATGGSGMVESLMLRSVTARSLPEVWRTMPAMNSGVRTQWYRYRLNSSSDAGRSTQSPVEAIAPCNAARPGRRC